MQPTSEPTNLEKVRELNAHAGRLATLIGFETAVCAFVLTARNLPSQWGQIKYPAGQFGFTVAVLLLAAAVIVVGSDLVRALEPPLPPDQASAKMWAELIRQKRLANSSLLKDAAVAPLAVLVLIMTTMTHLREAPDELDSLGIVIVCHVWNAGVSCLGRTAETRHR